MDKKNTHVEVSLPSKDLSFFKKLIEKMGWSIIKECTDQISSDKQEEAYVLEEAPLKLNITLTNYYNIRKGKKKIYRHSISDYNCAYKLFRHDYGKLCVSEKYKSIKENWTFTDNHNGQCPFIIRQYKNVIFTCETLDKKIESEIVGMIKVKYNEKSSKWYFEFQLGKIKT